MEELEAPMEQAQEDLHERAHHSTERWINWVAVSSALLAALAAVTVLKAGTSAEHAMEHQLEANDKWGYYQAKSIKSTIYKLSADNLKANGKPVPDEYEEKMKEYKSDLEETKRDAEGLQATARDESKQHMVLARGVTFFQVAIAIAAIAVLAKRPPLWLVGMGLGATGVVFLVMGMMAG